ncbi:V-type ATPase [Dentipellis sp. KUC8613]|nr:V-type ATPase [Dentipellis sp. KUC8613]
MAAQQSQGIQTLLEAEKDAAKVVQQARQYRQQRLKDARAEATKEIEAYKRTKEAEFKAFEDSHAGINQEAQAAVDKDTEVKLQSITDAYLAHKDAVVKKLLDRVVLVKPELHRNLRKAGLE